MLILEILRIKNRIRLLQRDIDNLLTMRQQLLNQVESLKPKQIEQLVLYLVVGLGRTEDVEECRGEFIRAK